MSDHTSHIPESDELTGNLRIAVEEVRTESVPPDALDRALERAGRLGARTVGRIRRRTTFWMVSAAAAAVLVVVGAWLFRPTDTWADVVKAVRAKSWLHTTTDKDFEVWLSPDKGISATRSGKRIEFRDHRLQLCHVYEPEDDAVYRLQEFHDARRDGFLNWHDAFQALFQADAKPDSPLEYGKVLGKDTAHFKLLGEKQRRVKDDQGRSVLEYELTGRYRDIPDPICILVRVDPASRLPHSWKVQGKVAGREMVSETFFDYPEKGPADVYAMGAPRTAKFIDKAPPEDVARIIAGVKASRERFDHYHAIVMESSPNWPWYYGSPIQIWRKGKKWRSEHPLTSLDEAVRQRPEPDAIKLMQIKQLRWFPSMACDGETNYWYKVRANDVPNSRDRTYEITEIKKTKETTPRDDFIPVAYALMPEFVCRPPLGIPNEHLEPVLETNPKDGPPGTVLLRVRQARNKMGRVAQKQAAQAGIPALPDSYRYWIDPTRGYIAMRWEMLGTGDNGKEESTSRYEVEKLEQSPQGYWYPTKVRHKNAIKHPDGTQSDQILWFFLDFNAELPDSLFRPS